MRERLEDPLHISVVMAEYLEELEATCAAYRHQTTRGVAPF